MAKKSEMAKRLNTMKLAKPSGARAQRSGVVRKHQKDLAKIAGKTTARNVFKKTMKATEKTIGVVNGRSITSGSLDKASLAYGKAKKKATKSAMKSFKKSK